MPPQPSDPKPGISNITSTRPTRAQRRDEVARVRPEEPSTASPASVAVPTLKPRRKPSKVPFNTYIERGTQARLEWFRTRGGYAVTDVTDLALREFMDRAGVPHPDENGKMPD